MFTSGCASQAACGPLPTHRSVCSIASLPPPLLPSQPACRPLLAQVRKRVDKWLRIAHCVGYRLGLHLCFRHSQRVHYCLRKSSGVSTSGSASLTVLHSVSASISACHSTSVLTTACASRPPCRQVAVYRSVCRLAFLPKPQLEIQEACRPVHAQVGQRVDKWLCIAQCVALRFCLNLS